jgi:hypothetical protein
MFTPSLPDRAGAGSLRQQVDVLAKEAVALGQKDSSRDREALGRVLHRLDNVRKQYYKLYEKDAR